VWSADWFGVDGAEMFAGVEGLVGSLRGVVPQQTSDASAAGGESALSAVVLPGGSVVGHGVVHDVDQVTAAKRIELGLGLLIEMSDAGCDRVGDW